MTFSDDQKGKVPRFLLPTKNDTAEFWNNRRFKAYENIQNHGQPGTPGHCAETRFAVAIVKKAIKEGFEGTIDL